MPTTQTGHITAESSQNPVAGRGQPAAQSIGISMIRLAMLGSGRVVQIGFHYDEDPF